MKLKHNQRCPVHGRKTCCGRGPRLPQDRIKARQTQVAPGVRRIVDEHHPRGYRELRSPAAMRDLLNKKIVEQGVVCGICGEFMDDYRDIVPDHIEPRGMGGARRDDAENNIQATHRACNLEKASKRL